MTRPLAAIGPILVTGAGGFIGGNVVQRLAAQGGELIGTTRDGRGGTRVLDVLDAPKLAAGLLGARAVVHCAVGGRAVTVEGTRNMLLAAADAGVERFVHLSTMSVYGDAGGLVAEDTPLLSATEDSYGGWKAAAEQACEAQRGVQVVRLRPTIVYGPGGSYWLDSMVQRISSGKWGTLGAAGAGTCNLVHVDDVVDAIAAALTSEAASGCAFNVNGPEIITWNAYFGAIAEALGCGKLREISPAMLKLRLLTSLPLKLVGKVQPGLVREWLLGVPGRSEIGLFAGSAVYPVDAARAVMGWEPKIGVKAGLAQSLPQG